MIIRQTSCQVWNLLWYPNHLLYEFRKIIFKVRHYETFSANYNQQLDVFVTHAIAAS